MALCFLPRPFGWEYRCHVTNETVSATALIVPHPLPHQLQKPSRLAFKSRKHRLQILIPQIPRHDFAEHQPEVSRHGQIAAFVSLRLVEPRPVARERTIANPDCCDHKQLPNWRPAETGQAPSLHGRDTATLNPL